MPVFVFEPLKKEVEELGPDFVGTYLVWKDITDNMTEVGRVEKTEKTIVHYAVEVLLPEQLKSIRLHPSTGGLRLLRQNELTDIQNLTTFNKEVGVQFRPVVAMFPDEIEALRGAFAHFGKTLPLPDSGENHAGKIRPKPVTKRLR